MLDALVFCLSVLIFGIMNQKRRLAMRVGVIGGGSIGLLVAYHLCVANQVTLYVRNREQKKQLNDQGLTMEGKGRHKSIRAELTSDLMNEDCFILCVKTLDVEDVLSVINNKYKHTPVVFLQNGMGHVESMKHISNKTVVGVVEHGALRINSTTVKHTGIGEIKLARYNASEQLLEKLTSSFHQPSFIVNKESDWYEMMARKLAVNAVINPLTAIFNIKNGEILSNTSVRYLAKRLCEEVALVLQIDTEQQWERIKQIAHQTRENESSMLTDIKKGRLTEIDAILGFIIQQSETDLPYTLFAYYGIKAIEEKQI